MIIKINFLKFQVDSNDRLYGSDQKFIVEVNKLSSKVLHEILTHLKYLGTIEQLEKQSSLALDLFIRMMIRADLQQSTMAQLAVNLWNLSQKHGDEDQNRKVRKQIFIIVFFLVKKKRNFSPFHI